MNKNLPNLILFELDFFFKFFNERLFFFSKEILFNFDNKLFGDLGSKNFAFLYLISLLIDMFDKINGFGKQLPHKMKIHLVHLRKEWVE